MAAMKVVHTPNPEQAISGGKWEVIQEFNGKSHKNGGINFEVGDGYIRRIDGTEKADDIAKNGIRMGGPNSKQYAADELLIPNDGEPVTTQPSDKKPVAPQPKPVKKARVYVRENDPVFNSEAKRSLPLLEQKYGKGNVQIIQIPQGDQKLLQTKLAEDLDADTFVYDHSGKKILGVPMANVYDIDITSDDAYAKRMEYAKTLGTEAYLLTPEQNRVFNEKYYAEEEAKPLNHEGTWAGSFPKDYKGCAYWGACHFNDEAEYFTQQSKVPSYSTGVERWLGINSAAKPIKTDEDFLKQFYFGADHKFHPRPLPEKQ